MDLDISQYLSIFVEESREHLQSMNDVLLELEKNPSDLDHINEIFRVAHTLKGMSGTMGFHHMANLTHEMENLLSGARSGDLELTEDVIDALFECFDALEYSVSTIIDDGSEDDSDHLELIEKLHSLLNGGSNSVDLVEKKTVEKATDLDVSVYIEDAIKKAKENNIYSYSIEFVLSDNCMLKAARAFIIFNTLEDLGEVIQSTPSVEDIEDEKFDKSFSVILISEYKREEVENTLKDISELEKIEIDDITNSSIKPINEEVLVENEKLEKVEKLEKTQVKEVKKEVEDKDSSKASNANAGNKGAKIGKTVRVDIDRLDNLMNLVSELIIIKTRMDDLSENTATEDMGEAIEYLERITTSLHDAVMKVRMVPIERVFNRFPRLVRDLSKDLNKEIDLEMSGEETEVDRTVIDEIGDPLIHLIRNSIDHGIELPSARIAAGKPEVGTVILKSYPDGNNVVIQVEDDGAGIDAERIKKKAVEKGIITERESENLTKEDAIGLLFAAGFSTSETVSDVSGRGVGLDVVKSKIEAINGSIEVDTTIGRGTSFIIRIPLSLAIIQALLIKLKEEIYAIPLSSIIEITNIREESIRDVQGQEVILYRGHTLPIVRLNEVFGIEKTEDMEEDLVVVIVKKGDKQAGLIVDSLIGQQEIVIKGLGKYLSGIKYLSGATILGNGKVSLIIDVNSLI